MKDKQIEQLIQAERERQKIVVNLIASENYVSEDVLAALGSELTNKYAEGYPGKRYYQGNKIIDQIESLAIERARSLFGLDDSWQINVQAYSGSPANLAIYQALVPLEGKIMGMSLAMGGHLTHGQQVSITGKLWKQVPYGVNKETEMLDYDELLKIAQYEQPKLIVAGYTAYSRAIDFKKFREIAYSCGAILMVDMSHIAGLVAGGMHASPFPYADVVMTTTHKTLRGPRGAMIFAKQEYADAINKAVFPGLQGGPHENAIAAIAVALWEAAQPEFKVYAQQVVKNTQTLAAELQTLGWRVVSGGTDTHLFLLDTFQKDISGKEASERLEAAGIIVNMNTIPFDTRKPLDPSGIRVGTAAVTTQGMKEEDMKQIAQKITQVLL